MKFRIETGEVEDKLIRRELLQTVQKRLNTGRRLRRLNPHQLVQTRERPAEVIKRLEQLGGTPLTLVLGPLAANVKGLEVFEARKNRYLEQELVDGGGVDIDSNGVRLQQGMTNYFTTR